MPEDARIEEMVAELAAIEPEMRDEPQAHKRAVIRMAIEATILELMKIRVVEVDALIGMKPGPVRCRPNDKPGEAS